MTSQLRGFAAWAGLLAGALFVLVEIGYVFAAASGEFVIVLTPLHRAASVLFLVACGLALPALIGIYDQQALRAGWFGPASVLVLGAGLVLLTGIAWASTFVEPLLAETAPELLDTGDSWLAIGTKLTHYLVLVGTLLFAVATVQAKVYSRLVAAALVLGGVALAFGDRIPVFDDNSTLLLGFAFAGYGLELRDHLRAAAEEDAPAPAPAAAPDAAPEP